MPAYEEVLDIAHHNVQRLGDQLNGLNELKQSLADARKIPDQWDEKFSEVAATTREYTNSINAVANAYLEGSNKVIGNNLTEFAAANARLNAQIEALTSYDFAAHFKTLQREIAKQVKADLRKEIEGIAAATGELGTTNEAFRGEIDRLHEVDLEAQFNRHQKLLSDVFNAINNINSLLTTTTQTLLQLQTEQGNIRRTLEEQHGQVTARLTATADQVKGMRIMQLVTLGLVLLVALLSGYITLAN